jgi:hypothetical protein
LKGTNNPSGFAFGDIQRFRQRRYGSVKRIIIESIQEGCETEYHQERIFPEGREFWWKIAVY